jgi:hypothetical protein
MNKTTIMEASVRKWEKIIDGKRTDGGVVDCPPCRIFYMLACTGCPIAEHTGKRFCKATPYPAWHYHQMNEHGKMRKRVYCPECVRLAKEMHALMVEIVAALKAASQAKEKPGVSLR